MKKQIIHIDNAEISLLQQGQEDYISLTDMAHSQMQEHIIFRWLSLKSTIEYIGEWEALYNPNFNYTEFGTIRDAAGSNNFVLSVKTWIERTAAIGIVAKAGRYGGTTLPRPNVERQLFRSGQPGIQQRSSARRDSASWQRAELSDAPQRQ